MCIFLLLLTPGHRERLQPLPIGCVRMHGTTRACACCGRRSVTLRGVISRTAAATTSPSCSSPKGRSTKRRSGRSNGYGVRTTGRSWMRGTPGSRSRPSSISWRGLRLVGVGRSAGARQEHRRPYCSLTRTPHEFKDFMAAEATTGAAEWAVEREVLALYARHNRRARRAARPARPATRRAVARRSSSADSASSSEMPARRPV